MQSVINDISNGVTKLLYVAPESLTKQDYIDFLRSVPISFAAVDEAHCISEWGHDFSEYRNLRDILDRIDENSSVGLTATATPKSRRYFRNLGFQMQFHLKHPLIALTCFMRFCRKQIQLTVLLHLSKNQGKSGIVYCLSRKRVEQLSEVLQVNGIKAVLIMQLRH